MNIKEIENEIIEKLEINSNVNWDWADITPNQEFQALIPIVKKLFKELKL